MLSNLREWAKIKLFALPVFRRFCISYAVQNGLLPAIFVNMSSDQARQMFGLPNAEGRTQLNQDLFAALLAGRGPGYFVEIGANDGFELSNTAYLEQKLGWRGLLIEANPVYRESLKKRRNADVAIKAVADRAGKMEFVSAGLFGGLKDYLGDEHRQMTDGGEKYEVECDTLKAIFDANQVPELVDFISIDIEGAECSVVRQFNTCGRRFRCGVVEHNHRRQDEEEIERILTDNGYRILGRGLTGHDVFFAI